MTQGGYQVIMILPIKNKEALLFSISVLNSVFTSIIQSPRFSNDYKFGIRVNTYQW